MTKRVLITGSSRGIGRAIAERLAQDGFSVVLNCRKSVEQAQTLADQIHAGGGKAAVLPFDVTDRKSCRAAIERDLEQHGPYFGVVCNAGITADAPFPALTDENWDDVLNASLGAFYNVVQPVVLPLLSSKMKGRIVTISSLSGVIGNRGQVNYSAAKAGLIGATKALSKELAKRGITVNSVAPGLIATEMTQDLPLDEVLKHVPMRRLGEPREVAAAVAFLFSEDAGYITGQVLAVNGGVA